MSLILKLASAISSGKLTAKELECLREVIDCEEENYNDIRNKIAKTRAVSKNELTKVTQEINAVDKELSNLVYSKDCLDDSRRTSLIIGGALMCLGGFISILNIMATIIILCCSGVAFISCGVFAIKSFKKNKPIQELENELTDLQSKRVNLIEQANNEDLQFENFAKEKLNNVINNIVSSEYKFDKFYVIEGGKGKDL